MDSGRRYNSIMAISRYTLFTDRLRSLVSVVDAFARQVASGLGMIDGNTWKIVRGSWQISNGRATSSTSPTNYPLATLKFTDTDVTISIDDPDPGAGAAFWVTDSGNWYAAAYEQEQVCGQCQNCTAWNASNCNSFGCIGNYNAFICTGTSCGAWNSVCSTTPGNCARQGEIDGPCGAWNASNCYAWKNTPPRGFCQSRNISNCRFYNVFVYCISYNQPVTNCTYPCAWTYCSSGYGGNCNLTGCTGNYNPSNCSAFEGVPCNCVVNEKVRILKSVSGIVSAVTETTFAAPIRSFKARISGNSVSISAYDATGYVNKIGSDFQYTFVDASKTVEHGIIISDSSYGQGNSIEEVEIEPTP